MIANETNDTPNIMRKSLIDLTSTVRYKSLASACARLLATAMLAFGGSLFINECYPTETANAVEVKDFNIKDYIKSHLTSNTYKCLDTLATKESNWNFSAVNGSHYGFLQGHSVYLKTADPVAQVRWGIRYVKARYGSMCQALTHFNRKGWH
jgi:hypothetical protein